MRRAPAFGALASRIAALAGVVVVIATAATPPALAHSSSNPSENLRTSTSGLTSPVPGVRAEVAPDGSYLTLTSTSADPLVVLGYSGEPFLQVSSAGVWRNANSLTTYATTTGTLDTIPATAGTDAPEQWEQVSSRGRFTWSDERIVWTGTRLPPDVMSEPKQRHHVKQWQIPLRYGDDANAIEGTIWWQPMDGAGFTMWLVSGLLLVVLGGAALAAFPQLPRMLRRSSRPVGSAR